MEERQIHIGAKLVAVWEGHRAYRNDIPSRLWNNQERHNSSMRIKLIITRIQIVNIIDTPKNLGWQENEDEEENKGE